MLDRSSEAPVVEASDGMVSSAFRARDAAGFGLESLRRHAAIVGLTRKAELLGHARVTIHPEAAGFARVTELATRRA